MMDAIPSPSLSTFKVGMVYDVLAFQFVLKQHIVYLLVKESSRPHHAQYCNMVVSTGRFNNIYKHVDNV